MKQGIGHFWARLLWGDIAALVVTVILILAQGCGPVVDRGTVLSDSPCAAPCWQGIAPGMAMSEEEIVRIVEALPAATNVRVTASSDGREVRWWWRYGPGSLPRLSYHNKVLLSGRIVQRIVLQVYFDLTVQEIVYHYGIPEVVAIYRSMLTGDRVSWVVSLVYLSRGVECQVALPWRQETPPALEPTSPVFEIDYFTPGLSQEKWHDRYPYKHVLPWPGYGRVQVPQP